MRLAIFGATGGTGLEVTRQALERGHSVRVLVRNPNRMPLVNENMRLVLGNVLERESVTKTILGSDAVINCLGQASLTHNMGVVSEGTRMIVEVMKQQGVRRLVITSSFGVGESRLKAAWWQRMVFSTLLRAPYADKEIMEPEVRASGLEWTLLRPVGLTNGPLTGRYRATHETPRKIQISRADVAAAILDAVEKRLWVGEAPTLEAE
jgi:putative NADH-flavin reductase